MNVNKPTGISGKPHVAYVHQQRPDEEASLAPGEGSFPASGGGAAATVKRHIVGQIPAALEQYLNPTQITLNYFNRGVSRAVECQATLKYYADKSAIFEALPIRDSETKSQFAYLLFDSEGDHDTEPVDGWYEETYGKQNEGYYSPVSMFVGDLNSFRLNEKHFRQLQPKATTVIDEVFQDNLLLKGELARVRQENTELRTLKDSLIDKKRIEAFERLTIRLGAILKKVEAIIKHHQNYTLFRTRLEETGTERLAELDLIDSGERETIPLHSYCRAITPTNKDEQGYLSSKSSLQEAAEELKRLTEIHLGTYDRTSNSFKINSEIEFLIRTDLGICPDKLPADMERAELIALSHKQCEMLALDPRIRNSIGGFLKRVDYIFEVSQMLREDLEPPPFRIGDRQSREMRAFGIGDGRERASVYTYDLLNTFNTKQPRRYGFWIDFDDVTTKIRDAKRAHERVKLLEARLSKPD